MRKNIQNTNFFSAKTIKDMYYKLFDFKYCSSDISIDLLKYAKSNLNRTDAIQQIKIYVQWEIFAYPIEQSIFEYSLILVTTHNLQNKMLNNVYHDKINDICANLDINNTFVNNKTLLSLIMNFKIDPYILAFLSPEQLHPEKWVTIIKKQIAREKADNEIETTDIYKCFKCQEKKCCITQMQTRSADEAVTTFVTCLVCKHTFTMS